MGAIDLSRYIWPDTFEGRQPQYPAQIDRDHPFASRCLGFYLPANNNSMSGNPSRTVSSFGIGDTFLRTSSQHITIPLVRPVSLTGKGATLIGIVNSTDLANSQCSFALTDGSSHFSVLFRGDQGGKPISGATWNAPSSSFRQFQGPAYASGVNYVVAFTADTAGNFSIYVNGVLQSGSYSNSGTIPSVNLTTLEIGASSGSGDYLTGSVFGALAFEGVLSVGDIRTFSADLNKILAASEPIWIGVASGAAALAGAATGQASGTGSLTTAIPIAAAAISLGTATAALSTAIPLAGVAVSVASASGALTAQVRLTADALAQALSSAALASGIILTASAIAQAAAQGTLSTAIQLIANAAGQASASATLTAGSGLSANAQASASASAALTIQIQLSAAALAQATASASLTAPGAGLGANAAAVATAQGSVTTQIKLSAAALAQAIASGGLTTSIPLSANAAGQVTASGQLDGIVLAPDPRFIAVLPARSFIAVLPARSFTASHKG